MGEHADDALDQVIDMWDMDLDDDEGPFDTKPKTVTCRYCGKTGLHWETRSFPNPDKAALKPFIFKWRTCDGKGVHVCPTFSTKNKMDASTRTFFVAGVKFRPDYWSVVKAIKEAQQKSSDPLLDREVKLVGEPKNPFDRYAVKVLIDGRHVGYVPKPINVDLWALKDSGLKANARLIAFAPDAETYQMFKIEVTFSKP